MKKNIYRGLFLVMNVLSIASLNAEIADRTYVKLIEQAEELVPTLGSKSAQEREADIQIIRSNLATLRAGTKSPMRLRRINKIAIDFGEFMNRQPSDRVRNVPAPAPQPRPQQPVLRGMTHEQRLETLLLYTTSLASTADVAIAVNQKNNAQTTLGQAAAQIPVMRNIIEQHPDLAERFVERVQSMDDRIAKTLEEVGLMQ